MSITLTQLYKCFEHSFVLILGCIAVVLEMDLAKKTSKCQSAILYIWLPNSSSANMIPENLTCCFPWPNIPYPNMRMIACPFWIISLNKSPEIKPWNTNVLHEFSTNQSRSRDSKKRSKDWPTGMHHEYGLQGHQRDSLPWYDHIHQPI